MPIATNLRRAREACGLSQDDLARASGLTQMTISRLENGRNTPYPRTVKRLARALRVRPDDLTADATTPPMESR
jgi:transcriptional regulator with XRE-family HTH domain